MTAQVVADQAAKTLRIAYQPFLSSSRTKQLTSLLSSKLPYTFIPVNDTSLPDTRSADIVLLSRGGKPFAPVEQRRSIDSQLYRTRRERDWQQSGAKYTKLLQRWEQVETRLPTLLHALRKHFSERIIQKEAFDGPLRILAYTGEIKDVKAMRQVIKSYRSLRRSQVFLHPILSKTQAPLKVEARKAFGTSHIRLRELTIEHMRDILDLIRMEMEKRYMGMANVRYPSITEPKPWILLPEDPVAAWGPDFQYKVDELIKLARIRFMSTPEEKEKTIEQEARAFIAENSHGLVRTYRRTGNKVDAEELLEQVKNHLRDDKRKRFHDDETTLFIVDAVGQLGPQFRSPKTRDDMAVYQGSDRHLVEGGAWRVAD
jgi:hypothetical protein